eukprot:1433085-Pleurochrysis_carterae.AAC.1
MRSSSSAHKAHGGCVPLNPCSTRLCICTEAAEPYLQHELRPLQLFGTLTPESPQRTYEEEVASRFNLDEVRLNGSRIDESVKTFAAGVLGAALGSV